MWKKSVRLEVRLGYKEKQDFTEACDLQGDTPSGCHSAIYEWLRKAI